MDARETWQALQTRLTAAQTANDHGDLERALAEITAALEIDPNFLAAHSLRERILATQAGQSPSGSGGGAAEGRPQVAPDGYTRFEQRSKRRRVDKRLDAARSALASGRLRAAANALDEVIELDPNLPDLTRLTAQFDELRRTTAAARRGPRFVAAGVFVLTVLGASWLKDSTELISRPMIAAGPMSAPLTPMVTVSSEMTAVGTSGERVALSADGDAPAMPANGVLPATPAEPAPDAAAEIAPDPAAAPALKPAATHQTPEPAPAATEDAPDDEAQVKQALNRYRVAYESVDASRANTDPVAPAALTRTIETFESTSLTFDTCDVRVHGASATAICQGSARHTPQAGGREPRIEPRTWSFTLRKTGADWKIDSARSER